MPNSPLKTIAPAPSILPTNSQLQREINQAVDAISPATQPSIAKSNSHPQVNGASLDHNKVRTPVGQVNLSASAIQDILEEPKLPRKTKPSSLKSVKPIIKYSFAAIILFSIGLVGGLVIQLLLISLV